MSVEPLEYPSAKKSSFTAKSNLIFFGHNCFLVETPTCQLLIDPWLSTQGAFFGSWYQYPANHHLSDALLKKCREKSTVLYLTHDHEDHFDLGTLKLLSPYIDKALIPHFNDPYLRENLEQIGLLVEEIADGDSYIISDDLTIKVLVNEIGINHDSALFIATDSFTFFNQNDCKVFDRLNEIPSNPTYYTVQFSGATWHPSCFAFSEEKKKQIAEKKVKIKMHNVLTGIRKLKSSYYIPAAGPAIFPFLSPDLSVDSGNIFIHQDEVCTFLRSRGFSHFLCPRPGESVHSETNQIPIPRPTLEELIKYRDSKRDTWNHIEISFDETALRDAVEARLDQIWDLDIPECPIIIFSWGDSSAESLGIDLFEKKIVQGPIEDKPYIRLVAEKRYFALMHSDYRWQDIYLSLRACVERVPDTFSSFANIFIFSDVSNIRSAFLSTLAISTERIAVKCDERVYEINRYCPHQGADLRNAVIKGNRYLICPRHGWEFDLLSGGQCLHSNAALDATVKCPAFPAYSAVAQHGNEGKQLERQ